MHQIDPTDPRALRDAFGKFATGVTVVTTCTQSGPAAITANSFSSVSLDPPLILWSVAKTSRRCEVFEQAQRFVVHVLAEDHLDLARACTSPTPDFTAPLWQTTADGMPLFPEALAVFECTQEALYPGGDHSILLGRIDAARHRPDGQPLLFHSGAFGRLDQSLL